MADDGWVTVGQSKKTRKGNGSSGHTPQQSTPQHDQGVAAGELPGWTAQPALQAQGHGGSSRRKKRRGGQQSPLDWQKTALRDARAEVCGSQAYANLCTAFTQLEGAVDCTRKLSQIHQLVVYGLGSLEAGNVTPRYQLALAGLLVECHLPGLTQPMQTFDPVFTDTDHSLLHSLGYEVIEVDEGGARAVGETPTMFYLPHCEAKLCDALLAANWDPGQLANVIILGNSFRSIAESWEFVTTKRDQPRPQHILTALEQEIVVEIPVPDSGFSVPSAFNNMGLHYFPADRLAAKAGGATWQMP